MTAPHDPRQPWGPPPPRLAPAPGLFLRCCGAKGPPSLRGCLPRGAVREPRREDAVIKHGFIKAITRTSRLELSLGAIRNDDKTRCRVAGRDGFVLFWVVVEFKRKKSIEEIGDGDW